MSLALVQDYLSDEEVQEKFSGSDSEEEEVEEHGSPVVLQGEALEDYKSFGGPCPSSSLPSATAIFSEVTGPPEFLKNTAGLESGNSSHSNPRKIPYGTKLPSTSHVRKELPVGAIVEAKPQAGDFTNEGTPVVKKESSQKPPEATAKLLGVCPECSVPKTYSAAREGLICPICKDRRIDSGDPNKRRGSKIKDKERSKRMKGQSSHATWKSETEMQLRQHFD